MTKYLLKRILRGLLSVVIVVAIVMTLIYTFTDREKIFSGDVIFTKKQNNERDIYQYSQWEKYGYLDYVEYSEFVNSLAKKGEIDDETRSKAVLISRKSENDSELVKEYIQKFKKHYESKGYTVVRLEAVMSYGNKLALGGKQQLFAYKDTPIWTRLWKFFSGLIDIDNVNDVKDDIDDRGISFTWYDPVYNTEPIYEPVLDESGNPVLEALKDENGNEVLDEATGEPVMVPAKELIGSKQVEKNFSPAIIGNGTQHKYLLYFDSEFPYIHQNLINVKLGTSYSVNRGVDIFNTMVDPQGEYVKTTVTYPTGLVEQRADNLHTASYSSAGTKDSSAIYADRYTDDYTNVSPFLQNKSRLGFSFVIGLISAVLAYCVALPVGIMMARKKDKLLDKIGTIYIIFILACPSLAYIFMVQALGRQIGMPHTFDLQAETIAMYILPIISLAMPSIASLMKWLRRYMIDQMNSDYVKFARSGGLSENEIFRKHIFKNAAIPIVHGIPGSVLSSLVGAIITEKIYYVPGVGNMLTKAISLYDNAAIVGLTLFYALISIISIILGDVFMAMVDPRISFSEKTR